MLKNRLLGGTFLIAGTCIGVGMLAMPVAVAPAGFIPAFLLLGLCWFVMYISGLLVLEANLWLEADTNFISMAKTTLGRGGEFIAWITYLLLLYSLVAAHLDAGSHLFLAASQSFFKLSLPNALGPLPWILMIGLVIFSGAAGVDGLNRILILGLIASFITLISLTMPHINLDYFTVSQPSSLFFSLPILATAFGYQVIVPTLRHYMHSNVKQLRRCLFLGSLIPLFVYELWLTNVLGVIPLQGPHSLSAISHSGEPAIDLPNTLATIIHNNHIIVGARAFVFFALTVSFLGITLSLFDFLADGFHIHKTAKGRFALALMTLIPPLIFTYFFPKSFIMALSYAGVLVAILSGLLPVCIVWVGRRSRPAGSHYRVFGGIIPLLILTVFSIAVIAAQIAIH